METPTTPSMNQVMTSTKPLDRMPPTAAGMIMSHPQYISTWRTTVCDVICTTNTEKTKADFPLPRKFKHDLGLTASLPYSSEYKITSKHTEKDPTPFQKLKFRGLRKTMNDELKKERNEFFSRIESDKQSKRILENRAVVMIQALFRGYRKRPYKPGKELYERRRYRPQPSRKDIQFELSLLASRIGLEPLKGLTLASPIKMQRKRRYGKFEEAAAIRLQCFARMVIKRAWYFRTKNRKHFERVASAVIVICKFMKYVQTLGQKDREENIIREKAARKIQNLCRVWASQQWVRRVRSLRRVFQRETDAAVRIKRSMFQKSLGLSKATVGRANAQERDSGPVSLGGKYGF